MKQRTIVYVAGPYTKGDVAANVAAAISAAEVLLNNGYAPYVPHLTHFWHMMHPHTYECWMDLDGVFLRKSHAILRLPGESPGADAEVSSEMHRVPIFFNLDILLKTLPVEVELGPN